MKLQDGHFLFLCLSLLAVGCASQEKGTHFNSASEISHSSYLADAKHASVDIVFQRGQNSHRFFLVKESQIPQVFIYHDRQLFKSLSLSESEFRALLLKSLEATDSLQRKPAKKASTPCRTPFVITIKSTQNINRVEGCRGSDEGVVVGKLIAEIEFMISADEVIP